MLERFFTLILFLLTPFSLSANTQKDFFSSVNLCSPERVAQELKEKTLDMCWNFGPHSHFRFVSGNKEIYFEIYLGTLPNFYNEFIAQVKNKFIEQTFDSSDQKQLIFSYKMKSDGSEEIHLPQRGEKKVHPDKYSYIITERRVIENGNPQLITAAVRKNHQK